MTPLSSPVPTCKSDTMHCMLDRDTGDGMTIAVRLAATVVCRVGHRYGTACTGAGRGGQGRRRREHCGGTSRACVWSIAVVARWSPCTRVVETVIVLCISRLIGCKATSCCCQRGREHSATCMHRSTPPHTQAGNTVPHCDVGPLASTTTTGSRSAVRVVLCTV